MSAEGCREKKRGIAELLAVGTELPSDLLHGKFRLELRGREQLFVWGCHRIIKYSEEEMILSAKGFSVVIRGERLVCSSYHEGGVSIEGYVCGVELDDSAEDKK